MQSINEKYKLNTRPKKRAPQRTKEATNHKKNGPKKGGMTN